MKHLLSLELIGYDAYQLHRLYAGMVSSALGKQVADNAFGNPLPRGWVAEVVGLHPTYKFDRVFCKGQIDYSQSNSKGSRGVYKHFHLDEGKVYEVFSRYAWGKVDRYFCTWRDGTWARLPEEEVRAWLLSKNAG